MENMKIKNNAVVYIHGSGGSADEAEHYRPLFESADVIGFDYRAQTPWEAKEEFPEFFADLIKKYDTVSVIGNSIGAYFAMFSLWNMDIRRAFFISPVVDMERLILDMMSGAGVTEQELSEKKEIALPYGNVLSWDYLCYVRRNPVIWNIPTHILYGENDNLTSFDTISDFSARVGASLTVMENGEHWFHTQEQMKFLDGWIKRFA